jgi:uncharacterized protein YndB with AHSA1/START domain
MGDAYTERAIRLSIDVDASVEQVWQLWTTDDGVRSFFSPGSNVDARPGGPYEIFFAPDAEPGMRGADDMRVLTVQPPHFLSFTWNAPPSLPDVRGQRTHVLVRFVPCGAHSTTVHLTHDGWGDGGQWDESFDYFVRAWGDVVLPRLKWRIENGPVDWSDPPKLG